MNMKRIQYILLAAILFVGFSCEKELESEGVSRTTTYLTYELTGDPLIFIPKGTAYAEPGVKALEGTTDVSASMKTEGTVDAANVGFYTLVYSATNSDGFASSIKRDVIVYDPASPATDLSGNYVSGVSRVAPARVYANKNVSIKKVGPGVFYVSDFLGGFYDQGFGYGETYAMTGYFILNADNTITDIYSHVEGWGDSLNDLTGGLYNSAIQTITWDAFYSPSNYDFKVTLVKAN
jgi:hypothetical protein